MRNGWFCTWDQRADARIPVDPCPTPPGRIALESPLPSEAVFNGRSQVCELRACPRITQFNTDWIVFENRFPFQEY